MTLECRSLGGNFLFRKQAPSSAAFQMPCVLSSSKGYHITLSYSRAKSWLAGTAQAQSCRVGSLKPRYSVVRGFGKASTIKSLASFAQASFSTASIERSRGRRAHNRSLDDHSSSKYALIVFGSISCLVGGCIHHTPSQTGIQSRLGCTLMRPG